MTRHSESRPHVTEAMRLQFGCARGVRHWLKRGDWLRI